MDTATSSGMSDLTILAILLAFSTVACVVALAAASVYRLDALVQRLVRPSGLVLSRVTITGTFGLAAVAVLLGFIPGPSLLQGWGGPLACVAVLGSLVTASAWMAAPRAQRAGAVSLESEPVENKAAA